MERRLTAMKIHQYMQQNERGYYYSVITNDGEEVILSGCGIKMFDCQKERIVQTISRFRNAIFALSHSQNKLFAVNASEKTILLVLFMNELMAAMLKYSVKQSKPLM